MNSEFNLGLKKFRVKILPFPEFYPLHMSRLQERKFECTSFFFILGWLLPNSSPRVSVAFEFCCFGGKRQEHRRIGEQLV